ncbi:hypothetical protein EVAR_52840_1 [Eumeta japonica]|uniref:Uncharacterized protein n=1 Tax=Eumeta variegata TaxID=151549 RepID=A0A4C1YE95_EUMVA|nr:hypothetical protein EVAR_52840_1 [Eumeta japonica]
MGDQASAMDNLIEIGDYNYKRFESLITKRQCSCETFTVDDLQPECDPRAPRAPPAAVSPHAGTRLVTRGSKRKWPNMHQVATSFSRGKVVHGVSLILIKNNMKCKERPDLVSLPVERTIEVARIELERLIDLSSTEAVVELIEQIFGAWKESRYATAVFCDLAKAFDCVHHDTWIRKLRHCGFTGLSLGFLKSYLSGRVQRVDINGERFSRSAVSMGVKKLREDVQGLCCLVGDEVFFPKDDLLWNLQGNNNVCGRMPVRKVDLHVVRSALLRTQRPALILLIKTYRTTSTAALPVLVGVPPADLEVTAAGRVDRERDGRTRAEIGMLAQRVRDEVTQKWQK